MAVSSSDKSESRNVNNSKSEDYRKQLESKEKKHRTEVARIREQHYEETQASNNQHKTQVEELRAAHKDTVTERDRYYQTEMEKVNGMYRQRLRDQAEDLGEKVTITKKSSAEEIKANKELQARSRERLDTNYKTEIKKMDEEFRDYANNTREAQKEGYEMQKTRYNKDKEKTVSTLSEGHQKQMVNADRDLSTERDYRKEEIGNLKERMDEQAESMRKSFRKTLDRDRAFNDDIIAARDIDQKDSIQNVKMRYQDALKDNLNATSNSQDSFRKNVANRMNAKVDSLEMSLADTEAQTLSEKIKTQKFNELEKNNLRREMKTSLEIANEQKKQGIQAERNDSRKTLLEKNKDHEKELHEKIRYYQTEIAEMRGKHRIQLSEKESIHSLQDNQQDKQTNSQIKNIKEQTSKEQKNLVDYYEANLADTKDAHHKDKIEFQAQYMEERNKSITMLNKKLQELERQYSVEKERERSDHATKIEEMSFGHRVDKSRLEKRFHDTVENLQKSHARELEFTKATSENKLGEINKQHREEMQRLQDRHTQEMASLASHKPKV